MAGIHGSKIICPNIVTCLPVNCCFRDIVYKIYEIRNTLLKKAQSLNIKVDKDYEIVHERMT